MFVKGINVVFFFLGVSVVIYLRIERNILCKRAVTPRFGFATVRTPIAALQYCVWRGGKFVSVAALPSYFCMDAAGFIAAFKAFAAPESRGFVQTGLNTA